VLAALLCHWWHTGK